MNDEELLELNRRGFIPGPDEREEEFFDRVRKTIAAGVDRLPRAHVEWVNLQLRRLYDFEPESISVSYSNRDLAVWQGAACWIEEDGVPRLQLREGFRRGHYLGIYSRDEVVAHEAAHAARAAFDEPGFEEFFAHGSGPVRWRRVLGPIVKRPSEAWVAMGAVFGSLFFQPLGVAATCLIGAAFIRLIRQHRKLNRAFGNLLLRVGDEGKARAALFRMTDREIDSLSRKGEVVGDETLRWRLIRLAYIKDGS